MSESPVKLSKGTVPTKDTKIILAGAVKVPPIGTYTLLGIYITSVLTTSLAIGCWQWGDKRGMCDMLHLPPRYSSLYSLELVS